MRMRGVKLELICSHVGPKRATGFSVIRLESAVFQQTARTISLPLLFVKGVILPFLSTSFHQPQRLGTIRHHRRPGGQTETATHTPTAGARPESLSSLKSSGRHRGPLAGVMEVEITQLLQFDLSIRPRPPSFTHSAANGHRILLAGLFKIVTDEILSWTIDDAHKHLHVSVCVFVCLNLNLNISSASPPAPDVKAFTRRTTEIMPSFKSKDIYSSLFCIFIGLFCCSVYVKLKKCVLHRKTTIFV